MLVDWVRFDAVRFDLDGVITPTAEIHERAWAALFDRWDFTAEDYLTYIDGKARYDGVSSFLASRGVELPWGDPSDPPGDNTICALGNRKNDTFNEVLARDGIAPHPGTVAVLAAAGMTDRFPVVVDGLTAAEHRLAGKPDPAMFLHAARLLDVDPVARVVVEDASSGVAAGVAGGFGFVLGVDRGGNAAALADAGADAVVTDLADTLEQTP